MAFPKKNAEQVKVETEQPVAEKPEVKTETVKDIPIVTVASKSVKITPNFTGNKYVGNTWYTFVKGEVIVVPVNVKNLLVEQNGITAM